MAILNDGDVLYAEAFNNKADKTDLDNKQDKITENTDLKVQSLHVGNSSYAQLQKNYLSFYTDKDADAPRIYIQVNTATSYPEITLSSPYDRSAVIYIKGVGIPKVDTGIANKQYVDTETAKKQDILTSGTNIKSIKDDKTAAQSLLGSGSFIFKTINGESLLGSGNIQIQGGGGSSITVDSALSTTSENPVQNKVITNSLNNKQDKFATLDSTNKKINLNVDYSTIGVNEGALISFGSELVLNAISNIRVTSPVLMQTTNIHNDNYTITWDATNEAIKITFHE